MDKSQRILLYFACAVFAVVVSFASYLHLQITRSINLDLEAVAAQHKTRLLFVTQCKGFRHQVLHQAEEIMEQLGAKNGFDVTITQMAENKLTPVNLKNLD
ncbi:MAG TPA: hypothetical protein VG324_16515, partial [Blastocatellia bacterium]|nr:hypothetical protein [Blastocatellia bacterium]